jgi:hypothetical protein
MENASMEGKSAIIQGLPFITIILALLFFIILRVISRFKKHALGDNPAKSQERTPFSI